MKNHYSKILTCVLFSVMFVFSTWAIAQEKTITGVVYDASKNPVPGVLVSQTGTKNQTLTNGSGTFEIKMLAGSKTLTFSSLGYTSQVQTIGNSSTLTINLAESNEALDEVVVVGYGTTKKVNLTGAVGTVSGEVLENRAIATVGQGLQGVLPGLNVTLTSGDPSQSVDFNIRGYESINGGSPLILVDNVPMDINQINPNDIASITVLKDASAAAIYGARAAFGVILVTTKKGKQGKPNINLSTEQTASTPIFLIDPVTDPFRYMSNQNDVAALNGVTQVYDSNRIADALRYSQDPSLTNAWSVRNNILYYNGFNDYQNKVVTDVSPQRKYDFSVSGASDAASYYASFGYLGKKGYLANDEKNQNFNRYNGLLSTDFKVKEWLSLNTKIIYSNTTNNEPHNYSFDTSINSVNRALPIAPLVFPDLPFYKVAGDRDTYESFIGKSFGFQNTLPYLEQGGRDVEIKNDTWFTQGVTVKPLKGLILKGDFSYNSFSQNVENVASRINVIQGDAFHTGIDLNTLKLGSGDSVNDFILNRNQFNQYFAFNVFGEYTYDKIKDNNFKLLAGFNQEELRTKRLQGRADNLITPGVTDINVTTGTQTVSGGRSDFGLRGAFFRFNYDYKGKYLVEVSGRNDGTSRFPKNDRFGFFPSASLGWRISEESFMKSTKNWLSDLKLRASYGELGNQIITLNNNQLYYPYVPSLSGGIAQYTLGSGALPTVSPAGLVSPSLTWESVNSTNVGLDASFLKNRLSLTADAYTRATKDMLLRVNLPAILGATEPLENGADLETKGWELLINWRDAINKDWKYGVGFNLSDNQTKITKYQGLNPSINGFYEGKNIGEIWGLTSVGLFATDADAAAVDQSQISTSGYQAGDMQYADLNGDGKVNRGNSAINTETGELDVGDLKVIGNTTPRYSFGFTPNVEYKGLSVSMFFQGVLKRDYYPDLGPHASFWPYNGSLVTEDFINNSWSPTNTNAYFARPRDVNTRNITPQTRYLQNAAYIRLKNVTINYNLPKSLVAKAGMSNASIYLSGQNVWEYSKIRETLDPEQTFNNNLRQQYYFERSASLGLRVTF